MNRSLGPRRHLHLDRAGEYAIAASVLKLTVRDDSNLVSVGDIESVAKSGAALRVSR